MFALDEDIYIRNEKYLRLGALSPDNVSNCHFISEHLKNSGDFNGIQTHDLCDAKPHSWELVNLLGS